MDFSRQAIKDRLIAGLRAKNSWARVLETSLLDGLVTPFAEEENRQSMYAEYLTRETRWDLAQNITSITTQSTINGYTPKRKIGATGIVKLSTSPTFDSPPTQPIQILRNNIIRGGDVDLSVLDNNTLPLTSNYVEVEVVQGTPLSVSFTAEGLNFEEFSLTSESIENTYYRVYVNNNQWNEVEDIREAEENEEVFQILNEFDMTGIRIRFGNGIIGKKLTSGDTIRFEYYETLGAEGNIESTGVVDTVVSTLYTIYGDRVQEIYVTNDSPIDGGSEIEDIEIIRKKAPKINQSLNAATTNESYKALVEDISYIYKASVSGALEYNEDNGFPYSHFIPSLENRVYISAFTDSGNQLTETQKEDIVSILRDRKAPSDIIDFQDVEFIKMKFNITAYASSRNITLSYLRSVIDSYLSDYYSVFNWEFKKPLYESDYKAAIDGIKDENGVSVVDHHDSSVQLISEPVFNNAYIADLELYLPPIVTESLEVWIRNNNEATPIWEKIGTDDGSGNLVGEVGYDLSSSSFNYSLGTGTLIVSSGLTGDFNNIEVKVFYSIPSLNIIPTKRNQILSYGESEIDAFYL